ncbi:Centromere protein M, partial [Calypte anna]
LVGSDEGLQMKLAEAILREKKDFKISIHLATSLPLPAEGDQLRPRIDLIVFLIDIKSKHSLKTVEASLAYVDASFFLGKVYFLVTGAALNHASCLPQLVLLSWLSTAFLMMKLISPFCFQLDSIRVSTAQRLLRILKICAGHVPGVSALSFSLLMKKSA